MKRPTPLPLKPGQESVWDYPRPPRLEPGFLVEAGPGSHCEWKGQAHYVSVEVKGKRLPKAGWYYPEITPGFAPMEGYIAFYCAPMDACYVGDSRAEPQPGGFYGGWITPDIIGPFKGGPGTWGW